MLTDNSLPVDDHAAEVDALSRQYPRWTIWFGPFTRSWWALPPRGQDAGGFVEAATPQKLIARIEMYPAVPPPPGHRPAPGAASPVPAPPPPWPPADDVRQDVRRPSNLLRLEGVTPPPARRVPVVAWPGGPTR